MIDYRAGSNPVDIDVMVELVKFFRIYITTGELVVYGAGEVLPGPGYETDGERATALAGHCSTYLE